MQLQKNKKSLEELYNFYLSVDDGLDNKWGKIFFFKLFNSNYTYFFSSFPQKGYAIISTVDENIEILALAVDKNNRRRGVAKSLLTRIKFLAKKKRIKKINLEVANDNLAAIRLYQNMGFFRTGIRKNYYNRDKRKIDAILMELILGI